MKGMILLGTAMLLLFSSCRQYETCATYADNTNAKKSETKEIVIVKR